MDKVIDNVIVSVDETKIYESIQRKEKKKIVW